MGRCYACFPIVGLLVGLVTCLMVLLLQAVMPPLLLAAWACAFMAFVTRGFHLDGLADLADGFGGGYTPERRLEIMKDSATGAFGSLALVLAILLKTSAIYSLIMAKSWIALAIVPAVGRFAIVVSAYKSSCARTGGLAKSSIEYVTRGTVLAAASFAVVFTLLLVPKFAPVLHRSSHDDLASGPGAGAPVSGRRHRRCARRGQRNYRSSPFYIIGLLGIGFSRETKMSLVLPRKIRLD